MWNNRKLCTLWWECKLLKPLWKILWKFLKMLNRELPYDPAISLLVIHPKVNPLIKKKILHNMSAAALFTLDKKWNNPKVQLMKWINKLWYIHTMGYYSAIKKMKFWRMLQHAWILKIRKWRKSDAEDPLPCDSIYTKCPKQAKPSRQKVN